MLITHFGHSAVLVEMAAARILFDPGNFSTQWHGLTGLDAVVITHQHPDHVDVDHVPALLAANPQARVYQEAGVVATLAIPGAHSLQPDTRVRLGALTIAAVGGWHAIIHPDMERVGNIGIVLFSEGEPTFFHPGDALDHVPAGVDILALPMHGPWAAMREHVDFLRAVAPQHAFGIHDALLSERGYQLAYSRYQNMGSAHMHDLRDGRALQV